MKIGKMIAESKVLFLGQQDGDECWFTLATFDMGDDGFMVAQRDMETEDSEPWNTTPVRSFGTKLAALSFVENEVKNWRPISQA